MYALLFPDAASKKHRSPEETTESTRYHTETDFILTVARRIPADSGADDPCVNDIVRSSL